MSDREKELKEEMIKLLSKAPQDILQLEFPLYITIDPTTAFDLSKSSKDHYIEILQRARLIFEDRNAIYKDAFEETGLLGTVAVLLGDIARLRNMVLKDPTHGRQHKKEIEDKLLDIINQAAICLIVLQNDNYEGK